MELLLAAPPCPPWIVSSCSEGECHAEWTRGDATATVACIITSLAMDAFPDCDRENKTDKKEEKKTRGMRPPPPRIGGHIAATADRFTRAPPISDGGGGAGGTHEACRLWANTPQRPVGSRPNSGVHAEALNLSQERHLSTLRSETWRRLDPTEEKERGRGGGRHERVRGRTALTKRTKGLDSTRQGGCSCIFPTDDQTCRSAYCNFGTYKYVGTKLGDAGLRLDSTCMPCMRARSLPTQRGRILIDGCYL